MTLPKIAIWSLFRDSAGAYLERYQKRFNAIDYPRDLLRLYAVEGDSMDNTWGLLANWSVQDPRIFPERLWVNIPRHAGEPHRDRLRALGRCGNACIERIVKDGWAEYAMLLESDLIYQPDLINKLLATGKDIISPMIWIPFDGHIQFYDVWAFRFQAGRKFPPFTPEWYGENYKELFQVQATGSVVLFKAGYLYNGARYTEEEAIVGLCKSCNAPVWVDPNTHVIHPPVAGTRA
jgi:hypothetical protein